MFLPDEIQAIRAQFPALESNSALFLDGPAGSQVPRRVGKAVTDYMFQTNANSGGLFPTSVATDALFDEALQTYAAFMGTDDPKSIVFGPNMTSLTFMISRALAKTWNEGDEIVLSELEHDANVSPWVIAAQARGVTVRRIPVRAEDCTLDMDHFRGLLTSKTRLVAVGYASNATGTINPVHQISAMAHEVGALSYVDAVHYAPHGMIDVKEIGCDFTVASSYKFFGPHVGILWGRRELLESLDSEKVRPAYDTTPDRWMNGTPNYEGIAGAAEAIRYIASLAPEAANKELREQIVAAYERIGAHESKLLHRLLEGLMCRGDFKVWGITRSADLGKRVPTLSLTHARYTPHEMASRLAERGVYCWSGNHYALPFTQSLGLEPQGTLRIGLLHYNTLEEVDRLLAELGSIV